VRTALQNIVKSLNTSNLYRPAVGKILNQEQESIMKIWLWDDYVPEIENDTKAKRMSQTIPKISDAKEKESLRCWDFDVWSYPEDTLFNYVIVIFEDFNILTQFKISTEVITNFLSEIKSLYHKSNPYHNFRHCIDVLQSVYYFLTTGKVAEHLGILEIFCLLISAICHDVDHPGNTNAFLIATSSQLALQYNDKSVLENFHCFKTFQTIRKQQNNILLNLTASEQKEFRMLTINTILATDLSSHLEIIGKFKSLCEGGYNKDNREHVKLLMQLTLKCSDVGNPARPFPIAKYWAEMVQEEFFFQGDQEKEHKLQISPYMDRAAAAASDHPLLAQMQINFIDYIVAPVFAAYQQLVPAASVCNDLIISNKQKWKNIYG